MAIFASSGTVNVGDITNSAPTPGQINVGSGGTFSAVSNLEVNAFAAAKAINAFGSSSVSPVGPNYQANIILKTVSAIEYGGTLFSVGQNGTLQTGSITVSKSSALTILDASGGTTTHGDLDLTGNTSQTLYRAQNSAVRLGKQTITGDTSGTLFDVIDGSVLTAGDVAVNGKTSGRIAYVHGIGAQATFGDITLDGSDAGTATAFSAENGANLNFGKLNLNASLGRGLLAVDATSEIDGGDITANEISTSGSAVHVDGGTLNLKNLKIYGGSDVKLDFVNGANVTIGDPYSYSNRTLSVWSNGFKMSLTRGSTLTGARLDLNESGDSQINIGGSTWTGDSAHGIYAGGNYNGDGIHSSSLTVSNGSTLQELDLSLVNVSASIHDSTLRNASLRSNLGSDTQINNVSWDGGILEAGNYGGLGTAEVSNSTLYGVDFYAGYNSTGLGVLTIGAGSQVNSGEVMAGVQFDNPPPYALHPAGSEKIVVTDGASLWVTSFMGLGARKSIYAGNGTPYTIVYNTGGVGELNVQNGSTVAIGGSYVNHNFFTYPLDPKVSTLTVKTGSSVNIDSTSSVYLGTIKKASDAVFNQGVLTVGTDGTLYGRGTINANVINLGGSIEPGLSPGHLTINGQYLQNAGDLILEIGGPGSGQYDQLTATGGFKFSGGHIVLELYGAGYSASDLAGRSFSFLTGGPIDWTGFDWTAGFVNQTGIDFSFGRNGVATAAGVAPVPEPSSIAMVGLGFAALLCRRAQRRK